MLDEGSEVYSSFLLQNKCPFDVHILMERENEAAMEHGHCISM